MRISVFAQFDKRLALEANTIALHGAGVVVYDVDVYRTSRTVWKAPARIPLFLIASYLCPEISYQQLCSFARYGNRPLQRAPR